MESTALLRYILRALGRSGLLDVVSLSAPELEESYEEMITEQKRLYSQVWSYVTASRILIIHVSSIFITELGASAKLHLGS